MENKSSDRKIDLLAEMNKPLSDNIQYPFVEIQGVTTEEELKFLATADCDPEVSLPLYLVFSGMYKRIGKIQLTLDYLLGILSIKQYTLLLHSAKDKSSKILLETAEELEKFIRL